MKGGWVYVMADRYRGTIYIGVTSDIAARVWAHREGRGSRFCARYGLTRLVYAEWAPTIEEAIAREKSMKKWNRAWKIELIERANPDWNDLWEPYSDVTPAKAGVPLPSRTSGIPAFAGMTG